MRVRAIWRALATSVVPRGEAARGTRVCHLDRLGLAGTRRRGRLHALCGLSFKAGEARCTATTAPLCASPRALVRKWRRYQPSTESTNRRVTAPSSDAS